MPGWWSPNDAFREIRQAQLWAANTPGHTVAVTNGYGSYDPRRVDGPPGQRDEWVEQPLKIGDEASAPVPGLESLGRMCGTVLSVANGKALLDFSGSSFGPRIDAQLNGRYPDRKVWVDASQALLRVR